MHHLVAAVVVAIALINSSTTPTPDPHDATCAHYAELMVKCQSGETNSTALLGVSDDVCMKGLSGKHDEMFGKRYVAMIECTRTAETCDALHACEGKEP